MAAKKIARKQLNGAKAWAGIPSADRGRVRLMIAAEATEGKKLTPHAAYLKLAQYQAAEETRKRKHIAESEQRDAARSREAISTSIRRLAEVRDLLDMVEEGKAHGLSAESYAGFARATLSDIGTTLEQTLADLGAYKPTTGCEGWFVTRFQRRAKHVNAGP